MGVTGLVTAWLWLHGFYSEALSPCVFHSRSLPSLTWGVEGCGCVDPPWGRGGKLFCQLLSGRWWDPSCFECWVRGKTGQEGGLGPHGRMYRVSPKGPQTSPIF